MTDETISAVNTAINASSITVDASHTVSVKIHDPNLKAFESTFNHVLAGVMQMAVNAASGCPTAGALVSNLFLDGAQFFDNKVVEPLADKIELAITGKN